MTEIRTPEEAMAVFCNRHLFGSYISLRRYGNSVVSKGTDWATKQAYTHLHIKWGVALGRTVIGADTRHLPPSRIHAPVTNPR